MDFNSCDSIAIIAVYLLLYILLLKFTAKTHEWIS